MKIPGFEYEFDDELSFKNFTNGNFTESDELDGKIIYESHFSSDKLDTQVFREDLVCTFVNCGLDNVVIPPKCTVIFTNGLSPRRYMAQNDGNDWIVDENNEPIKPVEFKYFIKKGLPIPEPKDIPAEKVVEAVDLRKEAEIKKIEIEAALEAEALSEAVITN